MAQKPAGLPSPLVFGTSGHIDHGKSSLIKALTGTDPDRLKEEKQSGMTIVLGFAQGLDANGSPLVFVDVPGHEHFIHTMLAGAASMDAVLMVIAADEGIMPQTTEHLHICQLLGITRGVIVLSRADLVSREALQKQETSVRQAFAGSFLEHAPLQAVSTKTGSGLSELRNILTNIAQNNTPHNLKQPFRMLIDRSFHIKGFGTVITGPVLSGKLSLKESTWLYPQQQAVRVRRMEINNKEVTLIREGERVALNLAGFSHHVLRRGDQLATKDSLLTGSLLNVQAKLLKQENLLKTAPVALKKGVRIRVHLNANQVMARVIPLETTDWQPDQTQYIQLRLEKPLSTRFLDRFVLRSNSPLLTIGGGVVIEPAALKSTVSPSLPTTKRLYQLQAAPAPEKIIAAALGRPHALLLQSEISPRTAISPEELAKIRQTLLPENTLPENTLPENTLPENTLPENTLLENTLPENTLLENTLQKNTLPENTLQKNMLIFPLPQDKGWLHTPTQKKSCAYLKKVLLDFHQQHPTQIGMKAIELAGKMPSVLGVSGTKVLLEHLSRQAELSQTQDYFQLPQHQTSLSPKKAKDLALLVQAICSVQQPPRLNSLLALTKLTAPYADSLLKIATKNQQLVRIKPDLYYSPQVIKQLKLDLHNHLTKHKRITVIEFKVLGQLSRKNAVALLEFFDAQHFTIRLDNQRMLHPSSQ